MYLSNHITYSRNHVSVLKIFVSLLLLYIYIYNPIFVAVNFGLIKVLTFCGLTYFFFNKSTVNNYLRFYTKECRIILFCILYCTFTVIINNGNAITVPYTLTIWFLETTIIPIFLINFIFAKNKISLFGVLIPLSLLAAVISASLFINPSLNEYVLGGVIRVPYNNFLGTWHRCFGISEGLTSSYGVIQGIMASICLLKGKQSFRFYIYALIIAFSAIINARTGMIPIMITLCYVLFRSFVGKNIFFFVFIALAGYVINYFASNYYQEFSGTFDYISNFFISSYDFFIKGDTGDDYYAALDNFIHFPDSILGVLFGEGEDHYHGEISRSDISYINQIYVGGLVYLSALICLQLRIYKKLYDRYKNVYIYLLLLLTAFIINFKGISFCISESFTRFVMLLYFTVLHNQIYPEKEINIGI